MVEYELQPDIISFTNLARAHHSANWSAIRDLWQRLRAARVPPLSAAQVPLDANRTTSKLLECLDEAFTENLLTSLVQLPKNRFYESELMMAKQLQATTRERLRLAQKIVAQLEAADAPLTLLGKRISGAITTVLRQR